MAIARSILLRASRSQWLAESVMRRPFAKRAIKRFMPGEELSDALDAAAALGPAKLGTILTKLGENLASLAEADAVRDHYLDGFDQIQRRGLQRSVVSVKPTQLGLDHSMEACSAHLEELAVKAESVGSFLWIDMEDSSYVDRTLELYRGLKAKHPAIGIAIQAYLKRTPADLESLMPLNPIVRLVKGAYAEPPHVAFPQKRDTDLAFYDLAGTLLEAAKRGSALPIFGSHDLALLRRIIGRAEQLGVAKDQYEIHMLYGIKMEDQRALAQEGQTMATLISYGSAWFPWYLRRLAERPANVWFVMRSFLG